MLLVPVPSPASLNEVTSAPVLVSMLLSAEMKCGLSASADVAVITTAAAALASMKAMRRIVFLLLRFLEQDREAPGHHPLPGVAAPCLRRPRPGDDRPAKSKRPASSPAVLGSRSHAPPVAAAPAPRSAAFVYQVPPEQAGNGMTRTNWGVTY